MCVERANCGVVAHEFETRTPLYSRPVTRREAGALIPAPSVPDSITVIASTRCSQPNASFPSWCAFVSAIEQIWSIMAGE